MRVVILIDNTPSSNSALIAEHGLSMYIESEGKRILVDTGLSGSFIDNAEILGVNLNVLDFCFLSHGHNDHTGGLNRFLKSFPNTKICLSENVLKENYFSFRQAQRHNLSTDHDFLQQHTKQLILLKESRWITTNIAAVFCDTHKFSSPLGNSFLTKEKDGRELLDNFHHEMALVFKTNKGLIIFSSCSHNGVINIMKACESFTRINSISHFIGGLHFIECNVTDNEVKTFYYNVLQEYPQTTFITGHCTSDKAKIYLKDLDLDIQFFHTGSDFVI